MLTVFLTGASGFIGAHLVDALLSANYKVIACKRSNSDLSRVESLSGQLEFFDLDLESIEHAFQKYKIDIVVHLATMYRKQDNVSELYQMIESNVSFPTLLLEMCSRHQIKGFINTGTFFEYDCSKSPVTENSPINPFNIYAKTKLAFEFLLSTYKKDFPISTLKIFSPYGPKDNAKIIPFIIKKALKGEAVELFDDGFQKLDFIYVGDVAEAYLKAIKELLSRHSGLEVFNIGTGTSVSIRELVNTIQTEMARGVDIKWGEASPRINKCIQADISKAAKLLGWKPVTALPIGIKKTIEYYKSA